MILSFSKLTFILASDEQDGAGPALIRTSHILAGLHGYYSQFESTVQAHFADEKRRIEEEVVDLVKLASWRDVNVHALQQSAQKTHKQLYRRIRRFREILRLPVLDHLRLAPGQTELHETKLISASTMDGPILAGPGRVAADRSKLFSRFVSVTASLRSRISQTSYIDVLEKLAEDMTRAQREYSEVTPPRNLDKIDYKRWSSSLFSKKKRAWNDFLKEMRGVGFSTNVHSEIAKKHRNLRLVLEQPDFRAQASASFATVSAVEHYFHRSTEVLLDSIKAAVSHHGDLTNGDVQRAMALLESVYDLAVISRARCAS